MTTVVLAPAPCAGADSDPSVISMIRPGERDADGVDECPEEHDGAEMVPEPHVER